LEPLDPIEPLHFMELVSDDEICDVVFEEQQGMIVFISIFGCLV